MPAAQTPAGRLRKYYRDAWGIDTLRRTPSQVRVRRSSRVSGLGVNQVLTRSSSLGLIEIGASTLVGMVAGAAVVWIWMRPQGARG